MADAAMIVGAIAVGVLTQEVLALYVGLGLALILIGYLFLGLRSLARSCTAFFGKHIGIRNLPPSYPDRFDAWREKNGITAGR